MIHESLPQTLTVEALAKWIDDNKADKFSHIEKIPLTTDEVREHEHDIAVATEASLSLKYLEQRFKKTLKKGTPATTLDDKGNPVYIPVDFTVPPTKGTDALDANIEFHSDILKRGYNEDITWLYMMPWPEEKKMVAVTIEGLEWPDYTKDMSTEQQAKFGKLFQKETREKLEKDTGMKVTKVKNNQVTLEANMDEDNGKEAFI